MMATSTGNADIHDDQGAMSAGQQPTNIGVVKLTADQLQVKHVNTAK